MSRKSLWYFATLFVFAMLPLVGCSGGGNGSSINNGPNGKEASISGFVEVQKSSSKSVSATAGALGKVEAFNAYSSANKAALGTAEVLADGSFTGLTFTLPANQSAIIFKATLTGPPETKLYNLTPMDLNSPPSGLANNNVQITINQASTATANAVMTANGATLDKTISPTKTFAAVAASVVANGGSVLSYAGNGIKLAGSVGDSAAKVAETCSVCHKSADLDVSHGAARYQDLAISNIVGTVVGADLQVTFNVKVNGSNKASYYNTIGTDLYRLDETKNRSGLPGTTISGGTSGNYTITIPGAGANGNSRYIIAINNATDSALPSASRPAGYRAMVLLDFPASPVTDVLGATSKSCEDCHGSYGNGFHRGYPAYGGKTCVVCHDAANTTYPRTPAMIHTIHQSGNMPTGKGTVTSTAATPKTWDFAIKFPSYMDNCSICHQSGAPLTAANSKAVSYDFCMTCHQSWDGFAGTKTGGTLTFHRSYNSTVGNCATCHDGSTAPATMGAAHNKAGLSTERGGLLYDGVDLSVTEGAKTVVTINSVSKSGNNLVIKWGAKYNGADTDPCFAGPATSSKPAFAGFRTLVDHGAVTTIMHNFAFLKAFFQADDVVNGANGATTPGQPNSVNVVFPGQPASTTGGAVPTPNTVCTATEATTTIALTTAEQALATTAAKMRVGLQGKPVLKHDPTTNFYYLRAKSPVYDLDLKTNAKAATFRRGSTNQYNSVTETDKCLKCHVGSLYQHGGNRVDNVELCVMCHNEASSEQNTRVSKGVDPAKTYDGKPGQTFGFKTMLHFIHASGTSTPTFAPGNKLWAIYRSSQGVYGYGKFSDAAIKSSFEAVKWPGAGSKVVYGSTPDWTINHTEVEAHYPRPLNDCLACHASGFSRIPDPTKAVATTINAGTAPWDNQLDDSLQGATAAACTSCHSGSATAAHAVQFGFAPTVVGNGRQGIIDAAK